MSKIGQVDSTNYCYHPIYAQRFGNTTPVTSPVVYYNNQQTQTPQQQNNKMSTSKKIAIGVGASLLAACGIVAAAIFTKGKTLKPANFAEFVKFNKANTVEEAAQYAKRHFGIQKFELGNDVELANWVNEGLTNMNNMFKGKAHMPNVVKLDPEYFAKKPNVIAAMQSSACGEFQDVMFINDKLFKNGTAQVKALLDDFTKIDGLVAEFLKSFKYDAGKAQLLFIQKRLISVPAQQKIAKLMAKYYATPEKFTGFDARILSQLIQDLLLSEANLAKNPLKFIRAVYKDIPDAAKYTGKTIQDYEKMNKEELVDGLFELARKIRKGTGISVCKSGGFKTDDKFHTLYHEMGHLLHKKNSSLYDNLRGKLSQKAANVFKESLEKQDIAQKVSFYAQTNPREFVAECFAAMSSGQKLPQDVMDLYKYYKGPILPSMAA